MATDCGLAHLRRGWRVRVRLHPCWLVCCALQREAPPDGATRQPGCLHMSKIVSCGEGEVYLRDHAFERYERFERYLFTILSVLMNLAKVSSLVEIYINLFEFSTEGCSIWTDCVQNLRYSKQFQLRNPKIVVRKQVDKAKSLFAPVSVGEAAGKPQQLQKGFKYSVRIPVSSTTTAAINSCSDVVIM